MALAQARGGGGRTSGQEQVGRASRPRRDRPDETQSYQYLSYAPVDVSSFICLWLCRFSFLFVFLKTTFPLKAVRHVPEEAKRSLALVIVPGAVLLHALTAPLTASLTRHPSEALFWQKVAAPPVF